MQVELEGEVQKTFGDDACSGCQVHQGSSQRMGRSIARPLGSAFDVLSRTGHDTVAICVVLLFFV